MYSPRNRTSWDKYMLKDISKYNFYGRSQFVRLRGKYTHQCTHCAMDRCRTNNICTDQQICSTNNICTNQQICNSNHFHQPTNMQNKSSARPSIVQSCSIRIQSKWSDSLTQFGANFTENRQATGTGSIV